MIPTHWRVEIEKYTDKDFISQLYDFIDFEYSTKTIYPQKSSIFRALELINPTEVKAVILGQDPYHTKGVADGLAFSVQPTYGKIPPSLRNIYSEIQNSTGVPPVHNTGDLTGWAKQGVLLLNSSLTVEAGKPASHANGLWNNFTNAVLKTVLNCNSNVVFLLWGKFAQAKINLIDSQNSLILKAPHPSPFSAHTGFFGCGHFKTTNEYLESIHKKPIVW